MNWEEKTLGEFIHVKHGYAFKSEFFSDEGEHIVLTPGNFYEEGGYKDRGDKDRFYTADYPAQYLLSKGDLIVAMTEQGAGLLGSAALVPEDNRFLHNQRLGLVQITDPTAIDPFFLYKLFNTEIVRQQISASATGTKVRHTAPERIYKCRVKLPSLKDQKKITCILSAYDTLIENNLKRIKLLEELAQLTYEQWFVRREFPGYESTPVDPETGLPDDWKIKKLGEICSISGGGTPSKAEDEYWENGDITWFSPTDLSKAKSLVLLDSSEKITKKGLQKSSAKLMYPDSFMMTSRATIGLFGLIDKPFCTNQGFINITPKDKHHKYFLLHNFKLRIPEFINHASGATFLEISKGNFKNLKIDWPSEDVLQKWDKKCSPIIEEMILLTKQIELLKEARDILLPRLMTGMIDIDKVVLPDSLLAPEAA